MQDLLIISVILGSVFVTLIAIAVIHIVMRRRNNHDGDDKS